tara:strand:- start:7966 stop:8643 length:678 start_codon:yes stop_codon:yes gene_type:complete
MWRRQDYPRGDRHLIILDDGGSFDAQNGPGWSLFSEPERFPTVGAKFAAIADLAIAAGADALALFEDDDLYFPWHLSAAADVLKSADVSAPSKVLADDGPVVHESNAKGRHHGAWAFRSEIYRASGGYSEEANAGFDIRLLRTMKEAGAVVADPVSVAPMSYLYRWASAGYVNGSASGANIYAAMEQTHERSRVPGRIAPALDTGAAAYFDRFVSADGSRLNWPE